MSGCSIKLEVGKYYSNRLGEVSGPLKRTGHGTYSFACGNRSWTHNGELLWTQRHDHDLVEEYVLNTTEEKQATDPVNSPSHYASGAVECIDAIQASMSVEAFRGYCKGNVLKYVWRYEKKGGAESLRKAEWYLKRLLATFDADA